MHLEMFIWLFSGFQAVIFCNYVNCPYLFISFFHVMLQCKINIIKYISQLELIQSYYFSIFTTS